MALNDDKKANTEYKLHSLISDRWSPRAFDGSALAKEEVMTILEAARWSASSMNEQPWRFVYGIKGTPAFDKILNTLMEGNVAWAKNAGALVAVFGKEKFAYKDRPNRTWSFDLGLAVGNAVTQAFSMNIYAHQMGGVHLDRIGELTDEEGLTPYLAVAFGRMGDVNDLSDPLKERELNKRERLALDTIAKEA
ncbi:nitroreductase family protein [Sanyastnella coralliicola]|uniref:nitroreductase family protein n=1 Tax=Sanyastnella coralliicola TaxID=3069118 RepID=UPI0027BA14AA|nr:nitroreductase family protein [Longitalea sp. SCSIO 12813]